MYLTLIIGGFQKLMKVLFFSVDVAINRTGCSDSDTDCCGHRFVL